MLFILYSIFYAWPWLEKYMGENPIVLDPNFHLQNWIANKQIRILCEIDKIIKEKTFLSHTRLYCIIRLFPEKYKNQLDDGIRYLSIKWQLWSLGFPCIVKNALLCSNCSKLLYCCNEWMTKAELLFVCLIAMWAN